MVASKAVGPILVAALALSGCIFRTVAITPVSVPDSASFASLKVQLRDGSIAVFRGGARVQGDTLYGDGMRYNVTLTDSTRATVLVLDSIATAVQFRTQVNAGPTVAVNLLVLPMVAFAGYVGAFLLACGSGCSQ